MSQHLIAMKGHPATGKSTLARALATALRWPLIDKDDVKDHTLSLPAGNELAYAILWEIVATQLGLGLSVIADTPLSYPIGYATVRGLAERFQARLLIVETRLDEAEWRRRLEARLPGESAHKIRGWTTMQAQLRAYAGCWQYAIDPAQHVVVDTSQPLEHALQQVQAWIQQE